ncbi:PASTA domain-containing protein [Rhodococcus sp. CSLK01-03]|uniref:PASTA domain-containing protein n=1 Tax=Rhodococcus indonesiensis TaxID=3055869 RepID=A0ABT7RHC5_9NOCA|nr:PASTA domain-containing protein [Rhodococcus indonesiensis]MDM7487042.1 PASTA domain-containing protein [Rhodococcus indonesiensis]
MKRVAPYLRVVAGMFAAIFVWMAFLYVMHGDVAGFLLMLGIGVGLGYLAAGKLIRDRRARLEAERSALAARAEAGHQAYLAGDPAALAPPPDPTPRPPVRRGVVIAAAVAALFVVFGIVTDIQDGLEDPGGPDPTNSTTPPAAAPASRTMPTTPPAPSTTVAAAATTTTPVPSPTTSAAAPTTNVAHTAPTAVMPDVTCMDLQAAQDTIQAAGVFYSRSIDATGRGRAQILDRNWVVVSQAPASGVLIGEGDVVLSVVKDGEPGDCS